MAFPGCKSCIGGRESGADARFSSFDAVLSSAAPMAAAEAAEPGAEVETQAAPRCPLCAKLAPFLPFLFLVIALVSASAFGGETETSVPRLRPVPSGARRRAFFHCAKCGQGKKETGACKRCGGVENG